MSNNEWLLPGHPQPLESPTRFLGLNNSPSALWNLSFSPAISGTRFYSPAPLSSATSLIPSTSAGAARAPSLSSTTGPVKDAAGVSDGLRRLAEPNPFEWSFAGLPAAHPAPRAHPPIPMRGLLTPTGLAGFLGAGAQFGGMHRTPLRSDGPVARKRALSSPAILPFIAYPADEPASAPFDPHSADSSTRSLSREAASAPKQPRMRAQKSTSTSSVAKKLSDLTSAGESTTTTVTAGEDDEQVLSPDSSNLVLTPDTDDDIHSMMTVTMDMDMATKAQPRATDDIFTHDVGRAPALAAGGVVKDEARQHVYEQFRAAVDGEQQTGGYWSHLESERSKIFSASIAALPMSLSLSQRRRQSKGGDEDDEDEDDADLGSEASPKPGEFSALGDGKDGVDKKAYKPGRKGRRKKGEEPEQMTAEDEEERRKMFLERNRLAACKSRLKKKEKVGNLESVAKGIAMQNYELQQSALQLRAECLALRALIDAHTTCARSHVHGYLARERTGGGIPTIDFLAGRTMTLDFKKVPRMGSDDDAYGDYVEKWVDKDEIVEEKPTPVLQQLQVTLPPAPAPTVAPQQQQQPKRPKPTMKVTFVHEQPGPPQPPPQQSEERPMLVEPVPIRPGAMSLGSGSSFLMRPSSAPPTSTPSDAKMMDFFLRGGYFAGPAVV